jgi:hypothetical protein
MSNYRKFRKSLTKKQRSFFNILSKEEPKFLKKYFESEEIMRLLDIDYFCAMSYCSKDMYDFEEFYSRLAHSYAVALITWYFTKSKVQTITAFFHDITTLIGSHVTDIKNGDALTQEHTERSIKEVIENSKILKKCLKEDNIKIADVIEPKDYPIVDNDRPMLCADRIDGVFSSARIWAKAINLKQIKAMYKDMVRFIRKDGTDGIGMKTPELSKEMFDASISYSKLSQEAEDKMCMSFLGEIIDSLITEEYYTEDDI